MWVVQTKINKDEVVLGKYTHEQFSKANPKLNMAYVTFRKGLNELSNLKYWQSQNVWAIIL